MVLTPAAQPMDIFGVVPGQVGLGIFEFERA